MVDDIIVDEETLGNEMKEIQSLLFGIELAKSKEGTGESKQPKTAQDKFQEQKKLLDLKDKVKKLQEKAPPKLYTDQLAEVQKKLDELTAPPKKERGKP